MAGQSHENIEGRLIEPSQSPEPPPQRAQQLWSARMENIDKQVLATEKLNHYIRQQLTRLFPEFLPSELPTVRTLPYRGLGQNAFAGRDFGAAIAPEWFDSLSDQGIVDAVMMHEISHLILRDVTDSDPRISAKALLMAQRLGIPSVHEISSDILAVRLMADAKRGCNPGDYVRMLRRLPENLELSTAHGRPAQRILAVSMMVLHLELDTSSNSLEHSMRRAVVELPAEISQVVRDLPDKRTYEEELVLPTAEGEQQKFGEKVEELLAGCAAPLRAQIISRIIQEPRNQSIVKRYISKLDLAVSETLSTSLDPQRAEAGILERFINHFKALSSSVGSSVLIENYQSELPVFRELLIDLRTEIKSNRAELIEELADLTQRNDGEYLALGDVLSFLGRQEGLFDGSDGFSVELADQMLAPITANHPEITGALLSAIAADLGESEHDGDNETFDPEELGSEAFEDCETEEELLNEMLTRLREYLTDPQIAKAYGQPPESDPATFLSCANLRSYAVPILIGDELDRKTFKTLNRLVEGYRERLSFVGVSEAVEIFGVGDLGNLDISEDLDAVGTEYQSLAFYRIFRSVAELVNSKARSGDLLTVSQLSSVIEAIADCNDLDPKDVKNAFYPVYLHCVSTSVPHISAERRAIELEHILQLFPYFEPPPMPQRLCWAIPLLELGVELTPGKDPYFQTLPEDYANWKFYSSKSFHDFVRTLKNFNPTDDSAKVVSVFTETDANLRQVNLEKLLLEMLKIEPSFASAVAIAFEKFSHLGVIPGPRVLSELERRAQTPSELAILRQQFANSAKLRADQLLSYRPNHHKPEIVKAFQCVTGSSESTILELLGISMHGSISNETRDALWQSAQLSVVEILSADPAKNKTNIRSEIELNKDLYVGLESEKPERAFIPVIVSQGGLLGALQHLRSLPDLNIAGVLSSLLLAQEGPLRNAVARREFGQKLLSVLVPEADSAIEKHFLRKTIPEILANLHPEEAATILVPALTKALKGGGFCELISPRLPSGVIAGILLERIQANLRESDSRVLPLERVPEREDRLVSEIEEIFATFWEFVSLFPQSERKNRSELVLLQNELENIQDPGNQIFPTLNEGQLDIAHELISKTVITELDRICSEHLDKDLFEKLVTFLTLDEVRDNRDIGLDDLDHHSRSGVEAWDKNYLREVACLGAGHSSEEKAEEFYRELQLKSASIVTNHEKITAAKLIVTFGAALGIAGQRGLQIADQYCELPAEVLRETSRSYDKLVGISKLSAWETIKIADPDLAGRVAKLGDALEGGAFYSVFEGWLTSGEHVAIKVLNPNALPRFERMIEVLDTTCDSLAKSDPRYEVGLMLVSQVKRWVWAEFQAVKDAYPIDEQFREKWHGFEPLKDQGRKIYIPRSFPTKSTKIWVEEFIPGRNFTNPAFFKSDDPQVHQLIETVSTFAAELVSRAAELPPGRVERILADWHPGNFRERIIAGRSITKDEVAVFDRQFMIEVGSAEGQALQKIALAMSPKDRAMSLVTLLAEKGVSGITDPNALVSELVAECRSEDVMIQIRDMVVGLARRKIELPLEFALMLKNAHGVMRMRSQAASEEALH